MHTDILHILPFLRILGFHVEFIRRGFGVFHTHIHIHIHIHFHFCIHTFIYSRGYNIYALAILVVECCTYARYVGFMIYSQLIWFVGGGGGVEVFFGGWGGLGIGDWGSVLGFSF